VPPNSNFKLFPARGIAGMAFNMVCNGVGVPNWGPDAHPAAKKAKIRNKQKNIFFGFSVSLFV
jgi:hypothetical protein